MLPKSSGDHQMFLDLRDLPVSREQMPRHRDIEMPGLRLDPEE